MLTSLRKQKPKKKKKTPNHIIVIKTLTSYLIISSMEHTISCEPAEPPSINMRDEILMFCCKLPSDGSTSSGMMGSSSVSSICLSTNSAMYLRSNEANNQFEGNKITHTFININDTKNRRAVHSSIPRVSEGNCCVFMFFSQDSQTLSGALSITCVGIPKVA